MDISLIKQVIEDSLLDNIDLSNIDIKKCDNYINIMIDFSKKSAPIICDGYINAFPCPAVDPEIHQTNHWNTKLEPTKFYSYDWFKHSLADGFREIPKNTQCFTTTIGGGQLGWMAKEGIVEVTGATGAIGATGLDYHGSPGGYTGPTGSPGGIDVGAGAPCGMSVEEDKFINMLWKVGFSKEQAKMVLYSGSQPKQTIRFIEGLVRFGISVEKAVVMRYGPITPNGDIVQKIMAQEKERNEERKISGIDLGEGNSYDVAKIYAADKRKDQKPPNVEHDNYNRVKSPKQIIKEFDTALDDFKKNCDTKLTIRKHQKRQDAVMGNNKQIPDWEVMFFSDKIRKVWEKPVADWEAKYGAKYNKGTKPKTTEPKKSVWLIRKEKVVTKLNNIFGHLKAIKKEIF
jgi:hypothetical protein